MRIISWFLNALAIIILVVAALWIAYLLVFLSIVVDTTVEDVGIMVAILAFVLWRLHVMWGEDGECRCAKCVGETIEVRR